MPSPKLLSRMVLVVDDEELFRDAASDALGRGLSEARVSTAADGQVAIELIRKDPPRLVVTDLQMPVVDGFGVLEFIRSQRLEITTVVLSAFLSPEVETRVEAFAASAILEKPIDLGRLTNIVQGLLDSRPAGTPLADIVRILHREKRDATVTLSTDSHVGVLGFREGRLCAASIGDLTGNSAVEEIVRFDRARVTLTEGRALTPSTTMTTLELLTRLMHHAPRSTASANQQLTERWSVRPRQALESRLRAHRPQGFLHGP